MVHDPAARHHQALQASDLKSIGEAVHAIGLALADCRQAGGDIENDPAVILLARRLGHLCEPRHSTGLLRRLCASAVLDARAKPPLPSPQARGAKLDREAIGRFHLGARKALFRAAQALDLHHDDYSIVTDEKTGIYGTTVLHSDEVYISVGYGFLGDDIQVSYRRVRGRHDTCGGHRYAATMADLKAPLAFAAQVRRDLGLARPVAQLRAA